MLLESVLAYIHISAIFLLVIFLTSKTALMRGEVLAGRPAVLDRLARLDAWVWASFALILMSGAARMAWGVKGFGWYAENPLLWGKAFLFAVMVGMSAPSSAALRRWRKRFAEAAIFPPEGAVRAQRRWLMWQAHVMVVIPLLGALLASGY